MALLGGQHGEPKGGRLAERQTDRLRPHPRYSALCAPGLTDRVRRLAEQPGLIRQPILATLDGTIIDGLVRWQLARDRGQPTVQCLEFDLTKEEALRHVIQLHKGSTGLNPFCRILLALELEPMLKQPDAYAEVMTSSSNLTKPQGRDVRVVLAHVASVSVGNVTKVKQLLESVVPEVRDALIRGDIRIHRAWGWRQLTPAAQRGRLSDHRNHRDIERTIGRLVNRHVKAAASAAPAAQGTDDATGSALRRLLPAGLENVTVAVADVPGRAIVITRDLYQELSERSE